MLLLASNEEILYIDPYSQRHYDHSRLESERVSGMDVLYTENGNQKGKFYVYWTNSANGTISRAEILQDFHNNKIKRSRTELDAADQSQSPKVEMLINTAKIPRSITVDWVNLNFYWTDAGYKIVGVAGVQRRVGKALFSWNLDEPYAIIVSPETGSVAEGAIIYEN